MKKGFSLAELGIALVILLIVSTIAVISYFSIIDNAKEVKVIEEAKTIRLSLAREGVTPEDVSEGIDYESLENQVRDILEYHLANGTNLAGMIFKNEVLIKDGNYIIGELRTPITEVNDSKETAFLNILQPMVVKAETDINLDNIIIEVRKLDNNKMNKFFQEQLNGEWFVINDVYEKKKEVVESVGPFEFSNGLLDDPYILSGMDSTLRPGSYDNIKDNGWSAVQLSKHSGTYIEFPVPIYLDTIYLNVERATNYTYIFVTFSDGTGLTYYRNILNEFIEIKKENITKVTFSTNNSSASELDEVEFFGSYIKE